VFLLSYAYNLVVCKILTKFRGGERMREKRGKVVLKQFGKKGLVRLSMDLVIILVNIELS
jgi:hypothetical protein